MPEIISMLLGFLAEKAAKKAVDNLLESAFSAKCQVSGCGDKTKYETICCEKGICSFHFGVNIKKKKRKFVCPMCGHKISF